MSINSSLVNLLQYRFAKRPKEVLKHYQSENKMELETNDMVSDDVSENCKAECPPDDSNLMTKSPLNDQNVNACMPESKDNESLDLDNISHNGNQIKNAIVIDIGSDDETPSNALIKDKLINGNLQKKNSIYGTKPGIRAEKSLPSTSKYCSARRKRNNPKQNVDSSDEDGTIRIKDDENSLENIENADRGKNKKAKMKINSSDDEGTIDIKDDETSQQNIESKGIVNVQSKPKVLNTVESDDDVVIIDDKKESEDDLPEDVQEERLQFMVEAFPNHDKLEVLDFLMVNKWSVEDTILAITNKEQIDKGHNMMDDDDDEEENENQEFNSDDEHSDYESEELGSSDESNTENELTSEKGMVLKFFQESPIEELSRIPGCSRKKAEVIVALRPFNSWFDLINKVENIKSVSGNIITSCKSFLHVWEVVNKLMQQCEKITSKMEKLVSRLTAGIEDDMQIREQPKILNENFKLKAYQMIGLNWLVLMDKQEMNGILADEMGLGKTIQAISFFAHLMEQGEQGPHLVIVPASTLDNWIRELKNWCPRLEILVYFGSQEERRELRFKILHDEIDPFNIVVTTYHMVAGAADDRMIFKRIRFHYVIFDEAHMLKNMHTLRYQNLMKIRGKRRLLLTGTPLQNNLIELMSLLCFVMPHMFQGKTDYLKQAFSVVSKNPEDSKSVYEESKIEHAKRIIKPFILRRLKSEVLQQLPKKVEIIKKIDLVESQRQHYDEMVSNFSKKWLEHDGSSHSGYMMALRKLANHPLLMRYHYTDDKLHEMSELMLKEPTHQAANQQFVFEDMQIMSDFELNRLCKMYQHINNYQLSNDLILDSGKFITLDELLPELKENGDRVLLFSQFVIVLDIIEEYMKIRDYKYCRLDGSTHVKDRQELIDRYNNESDIFIFLLSTRAGGLGINLTAANTVILHDIDFNPYNDKQAEDRCHRVGQMKEVTVTRLISKNTIEENMLNCAQNKLRLEKDITTDTGSDETTPNDVATLLKQALGIKE